MGAPVVALTVGTETVTAGPWRDVPSAMVPWTYVAKVAEAGGSPILLPAVPHAAEDGVARADALLITGGPDIDPSLYGIAPGPRTQRGDEARDSTELRALAAAEGRRIPVLAICRGVQLLAVARGGTLHQHVAETAPTAPGRFDQHVIRCQPGSHLGAALGASATLPCHHHQAVDKLGSGLIATAWSGGGVIEGAEDPHAPFIVGIQAHPEESAGTAALFSAFVEAARRSMSG